MLRVVAGYNLPAQLGLSCHTHHMSVKKILQSEISNSFIFAQIFIEKTYPLRFFNIIFGMFLVFF
jgi:hypothetical protein